MDIQHEIREFLLTRRARITPQQAGLPTSDGDRRRVPGLRREEVAMLAGVSVDYYTRLERGKLSGASDSVLDAIARALRLDDAERRHLYDLARSTVAAPRIRSRPAARGSVSPSVQRVLDSMDVPAVVQNGRLDLLAANRLGRALYAGPYDTDRQPPNLARFIFLDPRAEAFYEDHELAKNLTVAMLRQTAGADPLDDRLTTLIGELSTRSSDFSPRWARRNVHDHTSGRKVFIHPVVGRLDLVFDDFALPGDPSASICTFTAEPGSSTADGLALLASWIETQRHADAAGAPTAAPGSDSESTARG